jgi:hypothetical protein
MPWNDERMGPALRTALVPPLLIAILAGCGSGAAQLNTVAVERAIAKSILTESHIYSLVSCPAGIPQQKGRAFTCEAKLTVGAYPMYVTEIDGSGHVRYGDKAALVALDTARVERAIQSSMLAERGLHTRVACPAGVLQQKDLVFTCTARDGAKSYPFSVTEMDGSGHVRYVGR